MKNPYLNRGMIRDINDFYGRTKELKKLFNRIKSDYPQSVSVKGQRRIGKSSFLYYITQKEIRKKYLDNPDSHIFTFCDFQELGKITQSDFFKLILDSISKEIKESIDIPEDVTYDDLKNTVVNLEAQGYKLVIILDEFDMVTKNDNFDYTFFSYLRAIANKYKVAIITSSTEELQKMCHTKEINDSPFFNIFTPLTLGPLTYEEAKELVLSPSKRTGISYGPYFDFVVGIAGYHPFFIQVACSLVFEYLTEHEKIDQEGYGVICEEFLDEMQGYFDYIWSRFSEDEKNTIIQIITKKDLSNREQKIAKDLQKAGYVIINDSESEIFSSLFAEYVVEKEELEITSKLGKLDVETLETILQGLGSNSKVVVSHLIKAGGEETQRKLGNSLSMPKTTLSHNLKLLVERGIITKQRYFYTNIIKFSDQFWI